VTRAALIGIRSLDPGERALIAEVDVRVFTMTEVDRLGMERVLREALEFLADAPFLHLSLDLDAVDPMFAPGVGTPVRGGLSYREAHLAMELLAESSRLDSLEVVGSIRSSTARTRPERSQWNWSQARSAHEFCSPVPLKRG
jgi:arginase